MTSGEWTSKDNGKNYGKDIVVKIQELIMKQDMEYKETTRKTLTKTVHLMKRNYEKLNVDEQQSGIDDADEVREITAARCCKKK